LDAALEVMRHRGTDWRPRVADVVRAAGLSNEFFCRQVSSKNAAVSALRREPSGCSPTRPPARRGDSPLGKVERWLELVLVQADKKVATTTPPVLRSGSTLGREDSRPRLRGRPEISARAAGPWLESVSCGRPLKS